MQADENEVFVSAASVWEIATKVTLGKLSVSAGTAAGIVDEIGSQGFRPLDITVAHAHHAGSLAGTHRDPFDRMLIAQSVLEGISIVSNEALFDAYGVSRLW
jgi:PIN domain nuclease of toxin-antitoxin system